VVLARALLPVQPSAARPGRPVLWRGSSFEQGLGSLLRQDFQEVWQTRAAKYWRRKEFLPPACKGCDLADLCCGACPLYWDSVGDFVELAGKGRDHVPAVEQAVWRAKRRWIGQSKGVGLR
jgi:radical SAM protein with 4Fe4S-binding SPASM domain